MTCRITDNSPQVQAVHLPEKFVRKSGIIFFVCDHLYRSFATCERETGNHTEAFCTSQPSLLFKNRARPWLLIWVKDIPPLFVYDHFVEQASPTSHL